MNSRMPTWEYVEKISQHVTHLFHQRDRILPVYWHNQLWFLRAINDLRVTNSTSYIDGVTFYFSMEDNSVRWPQCEHKQVITGSGLLEVFFIGMESLMHEVAKERNEDAIRHELYKQYLKKKKAIEQAQSINPGLAGLAAMQYNTLGARSYAVMDQQKALAQRRGHEKILRGQYIEHLERADTMPACKAKKKEKTPEHFENKQLTFKKIEL